MFHVTKNINTFDVLTFMQVRTDENKDKNGCIQTRIDFYRSYTNQQSQKHKAAATLISSHESEIQNNCPLKKCISEHS